MDEYFKDGDIVAEVRKFITGAMRDTDDGKLDYEAFFSPLVLRRRAEFMHKNRYQKDGSVREGDNWQKGIPLDAYAKSLSRHYEDFRLHHRGYADLAGEDLETALCAIMFNVEGYLFEVLSAKRKSTKSDQPRYAIDGFNCTTCDGRGFFDEGPGQYTSCKECKGVGRLY